MKTDRLKTMIFISSVPCLSFLQNSHEEKMKQKHTSLLVFQKEYFVRRVLPAHQPREMHQQRLSSLLQG